MHFKTSEDFFIEHQWPKRNLGQSQNSHPSAWGLIGPKEGIASPGVVLVLQDQHGFLEIPTKHGKVYDETHSSFRWLPGGREFPSSVTARTYVVRT